MCGIAGIVGQGADPGVAEKMIEALKHRGPDGEGIWSNPGVTLAHRRLKIIDLSDAARQPMSSRNGRYIITFNGEIFNYLELRNEFPNTEFRSASDTEVILLAYERWGMDCLEKFVGMFAFAIWDTYKKELFCARDRFGIKPFYYLSNGDRFYFASEIKGLFAAGIRPEVNNRAVYDFLARDFYEHSDETFFKDVMKLPPGHFMSIREGHITSINRYWDLAASASQIDPPHDASEREEMLMHLMTDAVDIHLRSDVPVGVALSGGLDSSTLLALLDKVHPDPRRVDAFSVVFDDPAYSERPYVEAMARETNRSAQFLTMTPAQFTDSFEAMCLSQEEPFAGLPISGYAQCFRMAREYGFIVIMDGSGIDEGLAGYDRFRPALWADLFAQGDIMGLESEMTAAGLNNVRARAVALHQMASAVQPIGDVGKGQDLTSSARPDCLKSDFHAEFQHEWPQFERPFGRSLLNLMYRELRYTKLPRALRFRDKLSMAVGMELRPPFLDHRLLAFEFALPQNDYISDGATKSLLRRAAKRHIPSAIRLASKRSVQTPQREWFRGELRGWVEERLNDAQFWNRGWVDRKKGVTAAKAFLDGEGDNSFFIWQWINLDCWVDKFYADID